MPRASALSGSAFRTGLLVLLVVAVVLGGAGWLIYASTTATLEDDIRSRISEDFELGRNAFETSGEQGLVKFVQSASETRSGNAHLFGLFTADGVRLTGNILAPPVPRGWAMVASSVAQPLGEQSYITFTDHVGGHIMVIGSSLRSVSATSDAVAMALLISGLIIAVSAIAIGYLLSGAVSAKLEAMSATLAQVSHGNSEARLSVSPANDQIDHVSRQINLHLDRLSELMATMRNTTIAIAHDLRSPLNRVSMLLQEAADSNDPAQRDALLTRVDEELQTLKGVLDTILRISRIELSDDRSTFQMFPLALLAADLVETYEPVADAAGQTLRFRNSAPGGVPVLGDRRMVQQLLVNLIENASRYAGAGAKIDIETRIDDGRPVLAIADTGPGIPADQQQAVFMPFFRMDAERNSPGTGLGLALVKAIVDRHHAEIRLDDNHPGLCVTITFAPAAAANA